MSASLPNTIDRHNERYERLGRELEEMLYRANGPWIARSLHAHFIQDLQDWFYDLIWRFFSCVPQEQWPDDQLVLAEVNCLHVISFFQSFRGATTAVKRGYVPTAKAEWYVDWLLRLNVGDSYPEDVSEWLLKLSGQDRDGQLDLFSAAMSKCLPRIKGRFFLLRFYSPTLDLRVQATTVRAFGDTSDARTLHAEAISVDEILNSEIDKYSTGGGVWYILEGDRGMLSTQPQQHEQLFDLWTSAEYAREINDSEYYGIHRISPMDYRELERQIQRMRENGQLYVKFNRRMCGAFAIVPINDFLQHVRDTIATVESSEIGSAMKRGFVD